MITPNRESPCICQYFRHLQVQLQFIIRSGIIIYSNLLHKHRVPDNNKSSQKYANLLFIFAFILPKIYNYFCVARVLLDSLNNS